jgi:predicted glycosyltransferase
VTHAGLNAVAEVAAARKPAIVIPQSRPHEEQLRTARALAHAGLAIELKRWPDAGEWPDLLQTALRADGERWRVWSAGDGAKRAATVIESVACHH